MHANFDSKPLTVLVQSTQAQWSSCTAKLKVACELVVLDKVYDTYESDQGCWIACSYVHKPPTDKCTPTS